ncbi:hypothetical protein [Marinicella litoralis]|uniref:Uncharacterized protein n=1 Tax=Marinicella litoralis TaxID=644220 RepID=A0A4R6XJH9_9GAMM|nr:hypothetical protein [Marinicella litoralis]TDR17587.1 hypothetical protein C8D91_2646 [Marinicella litoralis]
MKYKALELLKNLSNQLSLSYEPQDWGIINADSSRFIEFNKYYCDSNLESCEKYQIEELIIASFNEVLLNNMQTYESLSVFFGFLNKAEHKVVLDYWQSLNEDEFPVARIIKIAGKN